MADRLTASLLRRHGSEYLFSLPSGGERSLLGVYEVAEASIGAAGVIGRVPDHGLLVDQAALGDADWLGAETDLPSVGRVRVARVTPDYQGMTRLMLRPST